MPLDLRRPYRCRNGAEAKAVEGPDGWFYGYVVANGTIAKSRWTSEGLWMNDPGGVNFSEFDLVNIPQKRNLDVWVNVYEDGGSTSCTDKENAGAVARWARCKRIACLHIIREYEEGEGL